VNTAKRAHRRWNLAALLLFAALAVASVVSNLSDLPEGADVVQYGVALGPLSFVVLFLSLARKLYVTDQHNG